MSICYLVSSHFAHPKYDIHYNETFQGQRVCHHHHQHQHQRHQRQQCFLVIPAVPTGTLVTAEEGEETSDGGPFRPLSHRLLARSRPNQAIPGLLAEPRGRRRLGWECAALSGKRTRRRSTQVRCKVTDWAERSGPTMGPKTGPQNHSTQGRPEGVSLRANWS